MSRMSGSEVGRSLEYLGSTSSVEGAMKHHCESTADVKAVPDAIFDYLDDHSRLSAHMSKQSWMMAGSRMFLELDGLAGRAIGSRIRLTGRVLGIRLSVEEIVTERQPPLLKVWQTTTAPKLLVIGAYRMGYRIAPRGDTSTLTVFIDYELPVKWPERWFGYLFGKFYARWCVKRMGIDAAAHFEPLGHVDKAFA
jgi:hypothetical protein